MVLRVETDEQSEEIARWHARAEQRTQRARYKSKYRSAEIRSRTGLGYMANQWRHNAGIAPRGKQMDELMMGETAV